MDQDFSAKVDAVVDAALEAFAVHGLQGARVDAIARSAGMNKRLLYHYVGDKTALFDAAARAALDRLTAVQPAGDDIAAWRVLCHASAAGRCPDLAPLVERLAGQSAAALGLRLLAGLLPEIAAAFPDRDQAEPAGRSVSAPPLLVAAPGRKPRIKLRPNLSAGAQSPD
ncbi:MAG TPA: helix-turn-helix domain-containing protein [Pseudomonadales bacterium]